MNEVEKVVSAAEFLVLQYVHGVDSLHNVEEIENRKINLAQEKKRLIDLYEMALVKREQSIDGIFGAFGNLPERLPSELLQRYDIDEEITEEDLSKIAKNRVTPGAAKNQVEQENEERILPAEQVSVANLMG
jgi:hypothetical protein